MKTGIKTMLALLRENRLQVHLIPAPKKMFPSHCIRAVFSRNCEWYRDFCSMHSKPRRTAFKTIVRRKHIERILERLANGEDVKSKYSEELLEIVERIENDLKREAENYE